MEAAKRDDATAAEIILKVFDGDDSKKIRTEPFQYLLWRDRSRRNAFQYAAGSSGANVLNLFMSRFHAESDFVAAMERADGGPKPLRVAHRRCSEEVLKLLPRPR